MLLIGYQIYLLACRSAVIYCSGTCRSVCKTLKEKKIFKNRKSLYLNVVDSSIMNLHIIAFCNFHSFECTLCIHVKYLIFKNTLLCYVNSFVVFGSLIDLVLY